MNTFSSKMKAFFSRKQFKYGTYAAVMTIVGIAIVILVNVGMSALENTYNLKIDTTQNKQYSLTQTTNKLAAGLTKDVFIYTTYPAGNENQQINEILRKIKALSPRIHLENKDTVKNPAFTKPYTKDGQTVSAGDIIVTDADNKVFRILDNNAQYSYKYDSQGQPSVSQITVEGSVVSAMNYISLGYIPTVYLIQGHGELTIANVSDISAKMSEWNYNLQPLNIAQNPDKIKPGDILLFANPSKDISEEERKLLMPLLEKGGRFFFLFNPGTTDLDTMPNIAALLKQFDISLKKGSVFEGDPNHYYSPNNEYVLVPDIQQGNAITSKLTNTQLPIVMPYSGALQLPATAPDSSTTITSLLKTSDKAYLRPLDAETTQKQPTDETGPFDLVASVERKNGNNEADSVKVVISYNTAFVATSGIADNYNNIPFFMYATSWMRNAEKDIVITPKALSQAYFRVNSAAAVWGLSAFSVLFFPIVMIVVAIIVYTKRKHL